LKNLHKRDTIEKDLLKPKKMKKNQSQSTLSRLQTSLLGFTCLIFIAAALLPGLRSMVAADQYDDQINALKAQNNSTQSTVNGLQAQAASYQDAISKLQQQIDGLQASIITNQAQQADLQSKIIAGQQEIDKKKATLGNSIKSMYVDGTPTTIEMLATSKDLSSFVDKQEYRTTVQNDIQSTLKKIAELQKQLQGQKVQIDQLISELQSQESQLASSRASQAGLLSYNQSQQATYNQQIQNNQTAISSLRAAQAAANRKLLGGGSLTAGDPGHGGYPSRWDTPNAQDSLVDSWGMYNRECVSYTAWKVYQQFGTMPYWGGVGNANQWPGDARAAGIPTGSTPKVHSVAISMAGGYGHAMWVEGVSGNTIHVSQMNYDLAGHYSEMTIDGSGLIYIYFGS
jgi:surface antigen/DNA-directed RNA polymerase delta subunit